MGLSEDIRRRQIGQHFVFGFHGHEVSENIRELIRDYHIGSVILMKRNIQSAVQTRLLIDQLQLIAKESGHVKPLLIGTDQENGLVSAFSSPTAGTQFPGAMALAESGSLEMANRVAVATGKELKMVGFNWVYSPVADVNSDSRNPVIGVRSFGDNPDQVATFASATANGFTSSGVAPTAKHFPGHGDTQVDSHLQLPRIIKSEKQLERVELVPFRDLVCSANPISSVMVGHMALPLLAGNEYPASLSPMVTQGLLREKLHYDGVVVTDCLEMEAVTKTWSAQDASVKALEAGVDIVMLCHRFDRQISALEAVNDAIQSGHLSIDELDNSGKRINRMKDAFASGWNNIAGNQNDSFENSWRILKGTNLALSRTAYHQCCNVIWGSNVLPLRLKESQELLLFTPEMESLNAAVDDEESMERDPSGRLLNRAGATYLALANQIRSKVKCTHVVYSGPGTVPDQLTSHIGAVVFVLRNADRAKWQKASMNKVLRLSTAFPVVLLSSCNPYDLDGEDITPTETTAYVKTYEFTIAALDAFAMAILG